MFHINHVRLLVSNIRSSPVFWAHSMQVIHNANVCAQKASVMILKFHMLRYYVNFVLPYVQNLALGNVIVVKKFVIILKSIIL